MNNISWVTSIKARPNRSITCPQCSGLVVFNAEEILSRREAGQSTSTPCRCGWHPGFPPEPWNQLEVEWHGDGFTWPQVAPTSSVVPSEPAGSSQPASQT